MADGAFCESCGVAIAIDDRFCGECGALQEFVATANDVKEAVPDDRGEKVQDTAVVAPPIADLEPIQRDSRTAKKQSWGFWDTAGLAMELLVRGVYIVACAGIAVLAFQNGEPLIGGGAIAYGLYILGGGKWFVY